MVEVLCGKSAADAGAVASLLRYLYIYYCSVEIVWPLDNFFFIQV